MEIFINVIIPLSLEGSFTYRVPSEMQNLLFVGQRVVVPFGGKKLYTGIIESIHNNKPELYEPKNIFSLLDDFPIINDKQLEFWKWINEYYLCNLGDIYRNVIPSALKLESETFIRKRSKIEYSQNTENLEELSLNEIFVLQNLEVKSSINLKEIEAFIPKKEIIPIIKSLYEKRLIELDEKIIEKYKPLEETYIKLSSNISNENLEETLNLLKRAEKQREAFMKFIILEKEKVFHIKKKELVEISSDSGVLGLVKKGILEEFKLEKNRLESYDDNIEDAFVLTENQQKCYNDIIKLFNKLNTIILQGVNSSGKTEIYFHLIEKTINEGRNCLFIIPEISIATQLLSKLKKRFGDYVGVYHSHMNQNERVETWLKTLNNEYKIIIGVRSSIFLPLNNIGTIIIDEEHDSSYKQTELKPFYNTKDCVQIIAKQHNANILLGSSTPSIESLFNNEIGKFGLVKLSERYDNSPLPEIKFIDLRKPGATLNISFQLKERIEECLSIKKQVIIFHNRRGYSPIVECDMCGHSPHCPNCDVSLTYHKINFSLKCHYCGYNMALPKLCPSCNNNSLQTKGIGTQQIEDELKYLFPEARIARMDIDTMRKKNAYEILMEKIASNEIDILIGTKMVTKGLDFENVKLVSVIRADSLLNIPNFRAEERAFQLLMQISGRAGRRDEKGEVLIQTYQPDNPIFEFIPDLDYDSFKKNILIERKEFLYPPYYRLIEVTFRHKKQEMARKTAFAITNYLNNYIKYPYLLGPEMPSISRINNYYIYKILLKSPYNKSTKNIKIYLKKAIENAMQIRTYNSVKIDIDIDPI